MIEDRASWGSHPHNTTYLASARGVKAHYTGGHVAPATLTSHTKCRELVRSFEAHHLAQGWNGLGYSMWVCNHAAVLGRGPHAFPAANGAGFNSGHYAILFLVGSSGVTNPTDAMKRHFHEARRHLMATGDAGPEIKLHKDGYSTDCPGHSISVWVRAGATLPGETPNPPSPTLGGDMQYSSFGLDSEDAYVVPPNEWTDVKFREEFADPGDDHIAGLNASILRGESSMYSMEIGLTLAGAAGSLAEIRTVEVQYSSSPAPVDTVVETGDASTNLLTVEETAHHSAVGNVQEGRKLRVQVRHAVPDTTPVTLTRARARVLFQR